MSYQPNIEQARRRFTERVANAYFQTWAAYGFIGEQFTFAKAVECAQSIADHCFPILAPHVTVNVDIDNEELRKVLMRSGPEVIMHDGHTPVYTMPAAPMDPDAPCGDGVVGD